MSAFSKEVHDKLDAIQKQPSDVSTDHIISVVRSIMASIEGELSPTDLKIHAELEELSNFIQSTRREIAGLRPADINQRHIPTATDELSAVVGATEEATGKILDCCSAIETIAATVEGETSSGLIDIVTRIYEACSFQDITGQRITKVVKTLQHIENKIDELLKIIGPEIGAEQEQVPREDVMEQSRNGTIDEKAHLLNGPQIPKAASTQDEIDALLASFDN
jgi:chemotaxis protein CheZ